MTLTAKGQARRNALLDAVLRVLERDGAGAVTHRSVSIEAGVPIAAATYYFSSLDELIVSALRRATQRNIALVGTITGTSLVEMASLIHEAVHANRAATVAQYELMFLAMRSASLRAEPQAWYSALEAALDPDGRYPERTRVRVLALDGLVLKMLWLGEPSSIGEIEAALAEIDVATSMIFA